MLGALENISRLTAAVCSVFGEFTELWTWVGALVIFGAAWYAVQHGSGSSAKSVSS